jgi:predicted MPP superfamily phosphohydrolase
LDTPPASYVHIRVNRRDFLRLGSAAALGAFGTVLYTFQVEPHWATVVERELPVAGLPPGLAGRRLVQISDLHVGPKVSDEYLVGCNRLYTAGEISLDDGRRLYINSGLGHLLQVRFNVRPEITSFTLQPERA